MLRNLLVAAAVVAQIGALGWMVYGRESVVANGMRIALATAPIDPRDPIRGDFVRLSYPMNSFANAQHRWPSDDAPERGDVVYAVLEETYENAYALAYFTTEQPDGGVFIRGRRSSYVDRMSQNLPSNRTDVVFGVEQLYVEQDSGIRIEVRQGIRGGMQNAMHMEIAVDESGTAVVTGYDWNDVAVQLEVTPRFINNIAASSDATGVERINSLEPHVRVTIRNVSDAPVTLNNPFDNCGFLLERVDRSGELDQDGNSIEGPQPANDGCAAEGDINLLTLAPEATHVIDIDLTRPRWQLVALPDAYAATHAVATVDLRSGTTGPAFYRVAYRASRTPTASPVLWQGDIVSQAFSSQGLVD